MKNFKRLRARHFAWTLFLVIVGIWWPAFIMTSPPEFVQETVNPTILVFCMGVALFGAVIKIIGYLASQLPDRVGVIGVSVELAGLILASVGPVSYAVITFAALLDTGDKFIDFPNSALILALAVSAVYLYRAIVIVPRFIFEGHDSAKDDA